MTDSTVVLFGELFDGSSPCSRDARIELSGDSVRLVVEEQAHEFERSSLRCSPRVFSARRFVALPNGWQLVCPPQPALDQLPTTKSEGAVAWLEQRIAVAVIAVLATFAGVTAFYFFGLPRVAAAVANQISTESERAFGERTLSSLDEQLGEPTDLDEATLSHVQNGFDKLALGLPQGASARLEFRDVAALGPNAFALPGGIVVVTDQLVVTCTPDQSIAVLAHELGHVRHRHALRNLIQQFGVGALGAVLGNDASGLTLSASTLPMLLATAQYSQDLEREADATGFALLQRAGYSPELFAGCLQKLSKKFGKDDGDSWGYASSHPPDAERIERARAAARASAAKPR